MKNILTYLVFFATSLFLFSCDKPAPTELVDDLADEFEVEFLTKDLNDNYITSGADTSGITQNITGITNLISVSGIKITKNNNTNNNVIGLAQAMFFDKSKPVKYSNGRLLAFRTFSPGIIKFNGLEARMVPYRLRYRDMGALRDTLLGEKYLLYNLFAGIPDQFFFQYNSSISFEYKPHTGQGINMNFDIPTPHEINGNIILNGNKNNRNIEAILEWNGKGYKRISIIVGIIKKEQKNSIPLYRIKTGDDGRLRIPKRLFSELPLGDLQNIVFTFVRSIESLHRSGNNELFVSSQSIHSIVIDIP